VLNPKTIGDGFIVHLKAIAALVALFGGNASDISYYDDNYPERSDYLKAIEDLAPGKLLLVYQSTTPGAKSLRETWVHTFSLIIKPRESIGAIFEALINGVPTTGSGLSMYQVEPVAGCYAMEVPSLRRRTLQVSTGMYVDYFEIQVSFTEKGA
jgi:hypothetical protein